MVFLSVPNTTNHLLGPKMLSGGSSTTRTEYPLFAKAVTISSRSRQAWICRRTSPLLAVIGDGGAAHAVQLLSHTNNIFANRRILRLSCPPDSSDENSGYTLSRLFLVDDLLPLSCQPTPYILPCSRRSWFSPHALNKSFQVFSNENSPRPR